jgi:hypothetical protein
MQVDNGDADRRVLSITDEQFELGKRENHGVYMAENGKLYLASAGVDANDQRLATLADFIPKAGGGYILELPE